MKKNIYINNIYISIILLIPLVLIYLSGRRYGNFMDNTYIFLPFYHKISEITLNLEIPYRFSQLLGGMDIYQIPQFSTIYPFLFFWLPIYTDYESTIRATTLITLFHLSICLFGSYFLFEYMTSKKYISIIGSIFITFSATYQSHYEVVAVLMPYCWIPFCLYFILKILYDKDSKFSDQILLGFTAGMLVLSCFNHGMIHALIIFLIFSISAYFSREFSSGAYKRFFVPILVFILISSSYVYACIENIGNSIRWLGPFGALQGFNKMSFEAFNQDKLEVLALINILGNTNIITPHNEILLGFSVAFLFVFNFSVNLNAKKIILLFGVLYLVLSTLGNNTPIGFINYHIPLFNLIRLPSTHFGAACILIIYCSISGFQEFIIRSKDSNIGFYILFSLATLFFLFYNLFNSIYLIIISLLILLLILIIKKFSHKKNYILLATLFFISWGIQNIDFYKIINNPTDDRANSSYINAEKVHQYLSNIDGVEDYRLLISDGASSNFNRGYWANLGLWSKINSFDVFMNPQPSFKNFNEVYYFGNNKNIDWYLERGAKYLVCSNDCSLFSKQGYSFLNKIGIFEIYENTKANKIIDFMGGECNHSKFIVKSNFISTYYECSSDSEIVFNVPNSINWHAKLNNIDILSINNNTQYKYLIPKGKGYFRLDYTPRVFKAMLTINILAIILCFFISIIIIYKWLKNEM